MAAAAVGGCAASTCHTSIWGCSGGGGAGKGGSSKAASSSRSCAPFLVRGRVRVRSSAVTSSVSLLKNSRSQRKERSRRVRVAVAADVSGCYSSTLRLSSPPCTTGKAPSYPMIADHVTSATLAAPWSSHKGQSVWSPSFSSSSSSFSSSSSSSLSSLSRASASSVAGGMRGSLPTVEDWCDGRHLSKARGSSSRCLSRLQARAPKKGGDTMLSPAVELAAALRRLSSVSTINRKGRVQQRTSRYATRHHHRRFARTVAMATTTETADVKAGKEGAAKMTPPYNVLITGSTKGVGYALARSFLQSGDNVIICSRSGERVEQVCKELKEEFGNSRVWGKACNVADANDVQELASFAKENLGYVDLWINNAGTNGYDAKVLIEASAKVLTEIVETNMLGVMICCREAIRLMRNQERGGHVFNMDGAGADGNPTPRYAAYGATKRGLAQLTKTLQAEMKTLGIKSVVVHNLSPGMVQTDLLMSGANTSTAKFFVNVLAEPADTVADYLVPRLREVPTRAGQESTYIRFLTKPKAYLQIIQRLLFKLRKDRFVKEDS